ncbi:MMPL family transporter [Vibrio rumoiensis]|uniref:MMPL family transporter n=1 Tax=Vibrio rumoiensis TaxID=76258 RepID=UPI000B5CAC12|nr:MMPL family transporter [Vibrio rumoiensis]
MLTRFTQHTKPKPLALVWLAVMLILIGVLLTQLFGRSLPIETNIMALLPKNQQDPSPQVAFDRVTSSMSDKVIFLISSPDQDKAEQAAQQFETRLKQLSLFKQVDGKLAQDAQQAWGQFFFPYRFQLLTPTQQQRLANSPQSQTQYVIQSVYSPFSGVSGNELNSDPFLLFRDYLKQLTSHSGNFRLSNGYLTTEYQGQQYVLISADLNGSAYSMSLQDQLTELSQLEQDLKQAFQQDQIEVLHTGVIFYAAHGTQSAKSEISTIGVGSLIGVILLILFVYRSMMPLSLALLSISCGLVAAFVITVLIFGKVHLFSLVFGASLIGVSIDYAFHYLTDRLAAGSRWNAVKGLQHIFIAISLGLVTSLVGYLGMLIAPFPGLQQLALFSAIGLFAAYATVVCWYPILAAAPSVDRALPFTQVLTLWLSLWQQSKMRIIIPSVLAIAAGIVAYHAHYNDDIRQLQAMPDNLKQQEQTIKTISGIQSDQQMLLVRAANSDALLDKLQNVSIQLEQQIQAGNLTGYQSISQFIASPQQQKHNFELTQSLYQSQSQPLAQALKLKQKPELDSPFNAVTIEQFVHSPISKPVRFMWLGEIEGQASAIITLNGVHNNQAIATFAEQQPDVSYLNKTQEISQLFGLYRQHVTQLLALAAFAILLLVSLRYGLKQGILIVLPPIIAGAVGIAVTVLTGSSLNLFNLLALILVLGIGIDYTLFFAEQSFKPHAENNLALKRNTTLLSISLSALTTILSFGLLALSATQAIHSFGITVLFGIIISWLLAPLAMKPSHVIDKESQ